MDKPFVKPLEWDMALPSVNPSYSPNTAQTPFGSYYANAHAFWFEGSEATKCPSRQAAKAAAQADYEARILAAIEPAPQEPEKYTIGDLTMDRVFQAAELTNVSDMQAVFDQVEVALRHAIKPAPVSVREAGEGDDSTPVDVSDKTKTTYFDSVPAIEAEMKLHKGRE